MRFLFCKIHCPLIWFCKPSASLYKGGPLKLEHTCHVPATTTVTVTSPGGNASRNLSVEVKQDGKKQSESLKSSIKKVSEGDSDKTKKTVQWLDFLGKQLVEIKEFESSDTEDSESEDQSNTSCICTIL